MNRKLVEDIAERVATSFAFTFLTVFTLSDLGSAKGAAIAGGTAALSLIKGLLASRVGKDDSASLAPKV